MNRQARPVRVGRTIGARIPCPPPPSWPSVTPPRPVAVALRRSLFSDGKCEHTPDTGSDLRTSGVRRLRQRRLANHLDHWPTHQDPSSALPSAEPIHALHCQRRRRLALRQPSIGFPSCRQGPTGLVLALHDAHLRTGTSTGAVGLAQPKRVPPARLGRKPNENSCIPSLHKPTVMPQANLCAPEPVGAMQATGLPPAASASDQARHCMLPSTPTGHSRKQAE